MGTGAAQRLSQPSAGIWETGAQRDLEQVPLRESAGLSEGHIPSPRDWGKAGGLCSYEGGIPILGNMGCLKESRDPSNHNLVSVLGLSGHLGEGDKKWHPIGL